MKTNCNYF